MRIALAEPFLFRYQDDLEDLTHRHHEWQRIDAADAETLAVADVLVGDRLPADLAASCTRLRLIQTPGAGLDGLALDALPAGVVVANTFHHGRSIAEYIVLTTLALHRKLLTIDRGLRENRWLSPRFVAELPLPETLRGQTVGIIGLGEIGAETARLLGAFDMRRIAIRRDPSRGAPADAGLDWVGGPEDLPRLCAEADVVAVTTPYSADTHGLIDASALAQMKPNALVVNVARGPVIDEDALYSALREHRIGGAALDVWWQYPNADANGAPSTAPFGKLDNVVLTPHISGVTAETFRGRVGDIAANINRLVAGEPLRNVVHGPGDLVR